MARFGFLSTYPPTRCGLATFTEALAGAMTLPSDDSFIVRIVDESSPAPIPGTRSRAVVNMRNGSARSIAAAIALLNSADVAVVQHEYGIYGGRDGEEVLGILSGLTVPTVVVLHTVVVDPTPHQKHITEEIIRLATSAVVMTETARGLLREHYLVDFSAVTVIPHGVAPLPVVEASAPNPRPIVLTWGLIGPGKGLEWGIRAFAELADMRPAPRYLVLGQTHPKVLAQDGDAYRDRLHATVGKLGLGKSVAIDGRYLSSEDLARTLRAADVVLLPYDSRTQVTSGVLAEAVAAGKPVVATAFPHAIELLSGGAGIVVPHEDPSAIATALRAILGEHDIAARMAATALQASRETTWPAVGARYRRLALALRVTVAA